MKHLYTLWATLLLLPTLPASAADVQEWFRLSLNDIPAGWQHLVETSAGDLRTFANVEEMRIGRGGTEVKIRATTVWVDRNDGTPVSMSWTQEMGGEPVVTTWTFSETAVDVLVEQGARTSKQQVPAPEGIWLTPQAAKSYLQKRAESGATEITFRTIMPDLGLQPVTQTWALVGPEALNILDRPRKVTRWKVATEDLPVEMNVWVSTDWRSVRTTMKAPFGTISSTMTDQATAQSSSTGPVPELFVSLFIYPTGTLGDQMTAKRARMLLTTKDGSVLTLPESGGQRVVQRTDAGLTLEVSSNGSSAATDADRSNQSFREASAMINSDDEAIVALRDKSLASMPADASAATQAEALRTFVNGHISSKGLSTAFATASDTARSRTGDCSEHGVLLAAMLRSAGIPARVASGLVWIDGVNAFGWHMWTQAMIDGRWVDLDATLPVAFTPGHVLVGTSAMNDGDGQRELIGLLGLLGNLDIEIVKVDR